MDARLKTLSEQNDRTFFKIPKFQRSYSWEEDEWSHFWRTIAERALDMDTARNAHSPVFMGAIVLQEIPSETIGSQTFKNHFIIDGQQRLVTISIFMAAVRDIYFGPGGQAYLKWSSDFLYVDLDRLGREKRNRLELQMQDQETYQKIISGKDSTAWQSIMDGSHPLNRLYRFFWHKLSQSQDVALETITESVEAHAEDLLDEVAGEIGNLASAEQGDHVDASANVLDYLASGTDRDWRYYGMFDPETLTSIIDQHMKFAVIEIQEEDNQIAFEVFETLNATGQPLAEVDKFRNGFFMLDPENSSLNYESYWLPMETKTGDGEILSTFFNEESNMRFGLTPKDKTYQKLMTSIKNSVTAIGIRSGTQAKRESVVNEFVELSKSLDAFLIVTRGVDPSASNDTQGIAYSLHLDLIRKVVSGPATPILMDIIKWSKDARTDRDLLKEVNEILHLVEGLLIRRLVGGIKPQQLRSLLAGVPKRINEGLRVANSTIDCNLINLRLYKKFLINEMVSWGPERYPTDLALLSNPLRDVYQTTGRKLSLFAVLWDLERSLNLEKRNTRIPSNITRVAGNWSIEHVLPQGMRVGQEDVDVMASSWREYWSGLGEEEPESAFINCVHSIGNLTILVNEANSLVGNRTFVEKKAIYESATRVFLTDGIKASAEWSPREIEDRARKLLNLVIQRWPYPTRIA